MKVIFPFDKGGLTLVVSDPVFDFLRTPCLESTLDARSTELDFSEKNHNLDKIDDEESLTSVLSSNSSLTFSGVASSLGVGALYIIGETV